MKKAKQEEVEEDRGEEEPEPVVEEMEEEEKVEGPKEEVPEEKEPGPTLEDREALEKERLRKELHALRAIISSVGTTFDFDEVASKAVMELKEVLEFERASMGLLDKNRENLMMYGLHLDQPSEMDMGMPLPRKEKGFWETINENRPHLCQDIKEEEEGLEEGRILLKEGIRSYISLPLTVEGTVQGVVCFGSSRPFHFNEEHIRLLEPVITLIARTLKGSRIEDQLTDTMLKMQLVDKAANMARTLTDKDEFLDTVLRDAQQAFGQFNFVYFVVDYEAELFRIRHFVAGFQYNTLKGYTQSIKDGILGKVFRTMSAWVVPDATKQPGFIEAPDTNIGAEIAAPSVIGMDVRGILSCITPYPFNFRSYEVWVVKQLAEIIGQKMFGGEPNRR